MSLDSPDDIANEAVGEKRANRRLNIVRVAAMNASVAGAVGSFGLMLWVGRQNPSWILLILFTIWVLSPFAALLIVNIVSHRWGVIVRATIYCVTLALTPSSLAIYADVVLRPPESTPAFRFLVVPLASWLVLTIAVSIAVLISRRPSRRGACA